MSEEEKGFKISDRRIFSEEGKKEEKKADEKTEERVDQPEKSQDKQQEEPKIDFSSFVLSLASAVLIHLGEVPDPLSNKKEADLGMAKQTIDVLNILEEKTRGNLTDDEKKIFENILADLRMRYVNALK